MPARAMRKRADAPDLPPGRAKGPITIVVSTNAQHLTVFDGETAVGGSTVSTGVADHPTPHGVFSIIEKRRFHASNIYSAAPMPFMQRITWSGVALHEGRVTGAPASHGCIRLPGAFAQALFRYTREGARVVIARDSVSPAPLYGPGPFASDARASLQRSPWRNNAATQGAAPATTQDAMKAMQGESAGETLPGEVIDAYPPPRAPKPGDVAMRAPISLLVHRKAGKIFVRRSFKPLFEVPIEIDAPNAPMGVHLFTAQADSGLTGPDSLAWTVVSPPERVRYADARATGASHGRTNAGGFVDIMEEENATRKRRRAPNAQIYEPPSMADFDAGPSAALSRLHLSPGVAARLLPLLSPGATLIVSDEGARGKETWNGTDFIALTD